MLVTKYTFTTLLRHIRKDKRHLKQTWERSDQKQSKHILYHLQNLNIDKYTLFG